MDKNDRINEPAGKKLSAADFVLYIIKGAVIGVGAILPGISGGVLCVVFGIYEPMMKFLAHPISTFKSFSRILIPVLIGWLAGFLGLARVVQLLFLYLETPAIWLFIGLICGTFPSLYRIAGEKGRGIVSWCLFAVFFVGFLCWMFLLGRGGALSIVPNVFWWLFCGVLWGIGLIVPGMSASPFMIYLGLYEPLTAGIAALSLPVLLPFVVGIAAVVILLSRLVNFLIGKYHSQVFHALLGIVAASVIAIVPLSADYSLLKCGIYFLFFAVGLLAALLMDKMENKLGGK